MTTGDSKRNPRFEVEGFYGNLVIVDTHEYVNRQTLNGTEIEIVKTEGYPITLGLSMDAWDQGYLDALNDSRLKDTNKRKKQMSSKPVPRGYETWTQVPGYRGGYVLGMYGASNGKVDKTVEVFHRDSLHTKPKRV